MPRLRTLALISGGLFAAIVVFATIGNGLIGSGAIANPTRYEVPAKIIFFTLFVAFGFSLIPLMVRIVLGGLHVIGTVTSAQPFEPLVARQMWIVVPIWTLMVLGLAVALPAAVKDGFFAGEPGAPNPASDAAAAIAKIPAQGTLVAAPGMAVASMLADSSLRIRRGTTSPLFSGAQFGGAAIFDFRIAGTATRFLRCRYYYITTARDRVATINVGISAEKMNRNALNAAQRSIAARLHGDGWHARPPNAWVHGSVVMNVRARRLDDPVPGEKPGSGEWILYVELRGT